MAPHRANFNARGGNAEVGVAGGMRNGEGDSGAAALGDGARPRAYATLRPRREIERVDGDNNEVNNGDAPAQVEVLPHNDNDGEEEVARRHRGDGGDDDDGEHRLPYIIEDRHYRVNLRYVVEERIFRVKFRPEYARRRLADLHD